MTVLLTIYHLGDQMKDEMGRTKGMYVGEKKWTQGFGVKTGKETSWMENLCVEGRY